MKTTRRTALASAAAVASAAFVRFPGDAAQFEYKFSHGFAANHPFNIRAVEMWAAVRNETNGLVEVSTFPSGQLGNEVAVMTQLRTNAIQFVMSAPTSLGSLVPAAAISSVGFAFRTPAAGLSALDGPLGAYVRSQVDAAGLIAYPAAYDVGMREIVSAQKPIRTVADLAGFKIRTQLGKIDLDLFQTLGASPVPVPYPEIYTGLQTHLIDGTDASLTNIFDIKLYEVAKYVSMTNQTWLGYWMLGNPAAVAALPPNARDSIVRNNRKYALLERKDVGTANDSLRPEIQNHGVTLNEVDPASFRQKLGPYYARWRAEFGETAWGLLEKVAGKLG